MTILFTRPFNEVQQLTLDRYYLRLDYLAHGLSHATGEDPAFIGEIIGDADMNRVYLKDMAMDFETEFMSQPLVLAYPIGEAPENYHYRGIHITRATNIEASDLGVRVKVEFILTGVTEYAWLPMPKLPGIGEYLPEPDPEPDPDLWTGPNPNPPQLLP